jgi:DNA primase
MEENFKQHLTDRGLNSYLEDKVYVNYVEEIVTFPLWSSTGQLLGYQMYNWNADKLRNNDTKGKYCTYRRKDWLTFWGLDFIDLSSAEPLYVVEGVWDAVSVLNAGYRCIAVLSNNPQQLKNLLNCLPCKTIALCDGDKAGKMLSRVTDGRIVLPEGKDCNDMSSEEIKELLNG